MSEVVLPEIERIQAMELRDNDAIVLTVREHISAMEADGLRSVVERHFPGHRVVIITGDIDLSLVRDVDEAWEQD